MIKIKQYIFKQFVAYVINDIQRHNFKGWSGYAQHAYGIKDLYTKTNHKTGDDITIVIDDIIFRQ